MDGDGHNPVRRQAAIGGRSRATAGSIESTAKTAGGLAQEVAQAQLEARNPAEQDRDRVVARAPLEAKGGVILVLV